MQLAHLSFDARAIFLGLAFGSFSGFASLISLAMVGKINEKAPKANEFRISGGTVAFVPNSSSCTLTAN